jgi:hypothetical protein
MAFRSIGERIDSMLCTATLLAALAMTQSPPTSVLGPGVDSAKSSKLKEGDLVRVNYLHPIGRPDCVSIYPALEQARAARRASADEVETKRVPSVEGIIYVGHNTPAKIERISAVDVAGREVWYALVTLGSGALRGQRFWIRLDLLRDAREPDPARKALSEDDHLMGSLRPIDPRYQPKVGDRVVVACYDVDAMYDIRWQNRDNPKASAAVVADTVMILPSEVAVAQVREDFKTVRPIGPGGFALAASGTPAIVELATSPFSKVRITSGPFEGQSWYVFRLFLCPPSAFEAAKARPTVPALGIAPAGAAEPERPTKRGRKRKVEAEEPSGDLVLTDLAVNPNPVLIHTPDEAVWFV